MRKIVAVSVLAIGCAATAPCQGFTQSQPQVVPVPMSPISRDLQRGAGGKNVLWSGLVSLWSAGWYALMGVGFGF